MRLPLTIDGVDFSNLANKYAYTINYKRIEGPNSGTMLDGSRVVDTLAWKAIIEWDLNDMRDTDLAAIQSATLADYVEVTYWDTMTNAQRTAEFIPTLSKASIGILRPGKMWWHHPSLTLEER